MPPDTSPSRFAIDLSRPLPDAGGGSAAFVATDQEGGHRDLMAVRVARGAPMRASAIDVLKTSIDQLLTPLGHTHGPGGDGQPGYYVIAEAPVGAPLSTQTGAWAEAALLTNVLRPAAQVLTALEARGVTHRGIRLNNLFQGPANAPIVLGAAWSEPPAMRQPALYEPPYSAACHPAGRGDGSIGDDVYALGVVLILLALGRDPTAGLDDVAIIHRKLALGSFPALVGDERLPPIIADLARNMLAEDPDHRPTPALLLDPIAARGRRVAARPPRRAPRPLRVGTSVVWDARTLAFAIGREPDAGIQVIRTGDAMQWLRRGLGDAGLAARLEELQRHRQTEGPANDSRLDATLLMRAVTQVDALAPLCWRGVSLWPDAVGTVLAAGAAGAPAVHDAMVELIANEGGVQWAAFRTERADLMRVRIDAQRHRAVLQTRGASGGPPRLLYALNPLLPCASPLLAGHWVSQLPDLPPALEAIVPTLGAGVEPIDPHILAFIAARGDRRMDMEIHGLNGRLEESERLVALLRLLASLQVKFWPHRLPALAGWIAARGGPLIELWHNRPKRAEVAAGLAALATGGILTPMLTLIEDAHARGLDTTGAALADQELRRIDHELGLIARGADSRRAYADRIGQEIVAGMGLTALAVMLVLAALG